MTQQPNYADQIITALGEGSTLARNRYRELYNALNDGVRTQGVLAEKLGIPQTIISVNLRRLIAAGIINCVRTGALNTYSPIPQTEIDEERVKLAIALLVTQNNLTAYRTTFKETYGVLP